MSPEQQAIVKALLMQGGPMTPMQQYRNAADNSAGGMHPAQKRFMAGNPVAKEPFDPLEALSAPQAMEQALLGSESRAPMTSPRPQASPMRGPQQVPWQMQPDRGEMVPEDPNDQPFQAMFEDLSPQEQAIVIQRLQSGMSPAEAFAPDGFTTRR